MKKYNYQEEAALFISENNITDIDEITGVCIYAFLLIVMSQKMHNFHSEANKYCYQLTDGTIGTLPKCSTDRLTAEVIELSKTLAKSTS